MKPFDLDAALAGAPVQMRNGKKVTQLHLFDAPETTFVVIGVVEGDLVTWTKKGKWSSWDQTNPSQERDLVMASKRMQQWVRATEATTNVKPHDVSTRLSIRTIERGVTPEWSDDLTYVGEPVLLREWEE